MAPWHNLGTASHHKYCQSFKRLVMSLTYNTVGHPRPCPNRQPRWLHHLVCHTFYRLVSSRGLEGLRGLYDPIHALCLSLVWTLSSRCHVRNAGLTLAWHTRHPLHCHSNRILEYWRITEWAMFGTERMTWGLACGIEDFWNEWANKLINTFFQLKAVAGCF